jgi:hypothetical protein
VPYWDYQAAEIPHAPARQFRRRHHGQRAAGTQHDRRGAQSRALSRNRDPQLLSLSSPAYRAPVGENGNFILLHESAIAGNSEIDCRSTTAIIIFWKVSCASGGSSSKLAACLLGFA